MIISDCCNFVKLVEAQKCDFCEEKYPQNITIKSILLQLNLTSFAVGFLMDNINILEQHCLTSYIVLLVLLSAHKIDVVTRMKYPARKDW